MIAAPVLVDAVGLANLDVDKLRRGECRAEVRLGQRPGDAAGPGGDVAPRGGIQACVRNDV
jgi:hypothetical protein